MIRRAYTTRERILRYLLRTRPEEFKKTGLCYRCLTPAIKGELLK